MSVNLLVIYEIADKASKVTSKKAYPDFEELTKHIQLPGSETDPAPSTAQN